MTDWGGERQRERDITGSLYTGGIKTYYSIMIERERSPLVYMLGLIKTRFSIMTERERERDLH